MHIVADRTAPGAGAPLASCGKLTLFDPRRAPPPEALRTAQALVVSSRVAVGTELLDAAPQLRLVATGASGTDHIDLDACAARGVDVASGRGANAAAVVEYCLVAAGLWLRRRGAHISQVRAGILGCGRAGRRLAGVLRALGAQVCYCDPWVDDGPGQKVGLEELAACDWVSLHVPLTARGPHPTAGLWDLELAGRMPEGGLLVQTSRGGVASARSLEHVCRQGFAAIDVWPAEPLADPGLAQAALLATPHIAGHSLGARRAMARAVLDAVLRLRRRLEGLPQDAGAAAASPQDSPLRAHPRSETLGEDVGRHGLPARFLAGLTGLEAASAAFRRRLAPCGDDEEALRAAFAEARLRYPPRLGLGDIQVPPDSPLAPLVSHI